MRISDWSSDVCSSDLHALLRAELGERGVGVGRDDAAPAAARRQRRPETLLGRLAVDDHHPSRVARASHRFGSAPCIGIATAMFCCGTLIYTIGVKDRLSCV